jgi:hypothetical protein
MRNLDVIALFGDPLSVRGLVESHWPGTSMSFLTRSSRFANFLWSVWVQLLSVEEDKVPHDSTVQFFFCDDELSAAVGANEINHCFRNWARFNCK